MFKGMIRLKCVDLSNWAANQHLFDDVSASDPIRFGTEGMDTVNVYVQKADAIADLQNELVEAMALSIEKFSALNQDFTMLMKGVKSVLDGKQMEQSFSMQLRLPISPYIEVVIKDTEKQEQ